MITMPRVISFNHFSATVEDMDRALDFWRDLLGLELLGRGVVEYEYLDHIVGLPGTRIEWAELEIPGGGVVELFRYQQPPGRPVTGNVNDPGRTHISLEVEGIEELLSDLRRAGVRSMSPEAIEIPRGDWKGFRAAYVLAPDDVVVELVERPS